MHPKFIQIAATSTPILDDGCYDIKVLALDEDGDVWQYSVSSRGDESWFRYGSTRDSFE